MPNHGAEKCCWHNLYGDPLISSLAASKASTNADHVNITGYSPALWNLVASELASHSQIVGAVIFADAAGSESEPIKSAMIPQIHHLAGSVDAPLARSKSLTVYKYPAVSSHLFATPFQPEFSYNSESISHTRSLTFFKNLLRGPYFDLEAIWDEHTYYEFENRSVERTMATMVQEPYVNHIPTVRFHFSLFCLHIVAAYCSVSVERYLGKLTVP